MKQSANTTLTMILILSIIASGNIFLISPSVWQVAGWVLAAKVALLILAYLTAFMVNIRILIPRLLLRNRLTAYTLSLLAWIGLFIVIEIGFEYLLINRYHLPLEDYHYFGVDWVLMVPRILAPLAAYSISVLGTTIILFRNLWVQSGMRMQDMEKQNAWGEVEKVRTRIDPEALFRTLDQAANRVEESPQEVSSLLMKLSKSLRTQLYESEYRKPSTPQAPRLQIFDLSSPALDVLIEKRYRLWRHLLLTVWFMFIVAGDLDSYTWSSLYKELLMPLCMYLGIIYFNIYFLMPRYMERGKVRAYLTAVSLLIIIIITPLLIAHGREAGLHGHTSLLSILFFGIGNMLRLALPIFGVSVLLLFRHWVKNEKRIAELETTTLLSELEQLQNQVNPHFLFNMLNNIIVLTKKNPEEAAVVLRKLNDMLKYQFHSFTKQSIRLGDDIRFLSDYLNLEKLRRDHFEFSIQADKNTEEIPLPPLLFIPFVENAVKHNNDNKALSFIRIRFTRENDKLCFICVNSKPMRPLRKEEMGGLGLPNIRRRLELLYGNRHRLKIVENESSYTVQLDIELKNTRI